MTIKNPLKKEAPKTMTEALKKGLLNAGKIAFGLAVGFLFVHWMTGGQDEIINGTTGSLPSQEAPVDRAPVKDSPSYVMEKHSKTCWTSEQEPKADLQGAAIVQFNSGKTVYVTNDTPRGYKLVDAAFNEALAAIGYGDKTSDEITVIALCI